MLSNATDNEELLLQLHSHVTSLSSIINRTGDAHELFPGVEIGMLWECTKPVDARELFPSNVCIAPPVDGFPINGYLVVELRKSLEELDDAMMKLSHTWWDIVKSSPLLVNLVFVTWSPSNEEIHDLFVAKHLHFAFRAPAPLLFACICPSREAADGPKAKTEAGEKENWNDEEDDYNYDYDYNWEYEEGGDDYDYEADEDRLYYDICAFLEYGPKEVQELASKFAVRFNHAVRWNPNNEYSPDKKNDGSFKKWLISKGFVPSAVFDRNKCRMSLPISHECAPKKTRRRGKYLTVELLEAEPFTPQYGAGTPEAKQLASEAVKHVLSHGAMDMGALRQVNQLGMRFNKLFFKKAKVNDGSWKRWLASLPELEVAVDPKRASHHGNQPTVVRPKLQ